jgi:aldehyde:ferredoxin oxidoreductase
MDCYSRGIVAKRDIGEPPIAFGDYEAMITGLEKIAYRQDIGNILAEGVKRAASIIGKGSERLAVHVKGLEPPGYDPRGLKGVALSYAVSSRGACHLRHMAYRPNLTGNQPFKDGRVDRFSYEGQAQIVKELESFHNLVDSMVLCKFVCLPTLGPILWDELANLYSIVTGIEVSKRDLAERGEKISSLTRSYNAREGVGRQADMLPRRFLEEDLKKGASKGEIVKEEGLNMMLREYYGEMKQN